MISEAQNRTDTVSTLICEIENITKVYKGGITANSDISLDIPVGETFGLLGPNGAGKTTLVKQIVGLLRPTSGHIRLRGRDVTENRDMIPMLIGYLPQSLMTLRNYRVEEAIFYTGRLRGLTNSQARDQTEYLIERFKLVQIKKQLLQKLSGGQHQLVALASSLIGYRPLIVLDEPTNNLDPSMRRYVWETLKELQSQRGVTIIIVTHNVLEAESVLTHVALIDGGRVIAQGSPENLKRQLNSKVRLEFKLKIHIDVSDNEKYQIEELPHSVYRIEVHRDSVPEAVEYIFQNSGWDTVEDLQIFPPSLEDVYIALTGNLSGIS